MKYEFIINKAHGILDDDFERAILAVKISIESILYDYNGVKVAYRQPNIIEISTSSEIISLPFDEDKCLKLITPSILDEKSLPYPQFRFIEQYK